VKDLCSKIVNYIVLQTFNDNKQHKSYYKNYYNCLHYFFSKSLGILDTEGKIIIIIIIILIIVVVVVVIIVDGRCNNKAIVNSKLRPRCALLSPFSGR